MAYKELSENVIMGENARFSPGLLTEEKAPEKAVQAAPVIIMDLRERSHLFETIHILSMGPKIPTTDDTTQSL